MQTRVISTNNLSLLSQMDVVVVLHDGRVKDVHRAPFHQRLDHMAALNALVSQPFQPPDTYAKTARSPIRSIGEDK